MNIQRNISNCLPSVQAFSNCWLGNSTRRCSRQVRLGIAAGSCRTRVEYGCSSETCGTGPCSAYVSWPSSRWPAWHLRRVRIEGDSGLDAVAKVAAGLSGPLSSMGPIRSRDDSRILITGTALGSSDLNWKKPRVSTNWTLVRTRLQLRHWSLLRTSFRTRWEVTTN